MKITIDTFAGIAPRVSPRLLSPSQAQTARNARLTSGDLESWNDTTQHADLAKPGRIQTLYLFAGQYWFQWNEAVSVVRGPVPDDTTARTYFTGLGKPRFTDNQRALAGSSEAYPVNSYTLGLPAPAGPLAADVGGAASEDDPALLESRAYVYTYISQFGEEGPPSPASDTIDVYPGQYVDLNGITAPSGQFVVETARIYRTASSGGATEFQFVAEVAIGSATYQDEIESESLGELLPSADWIAPPDDMHSLVALPNGILAGASGQDICISEQYVPHAWPLAYRHTADDTVVGLGVVGNSLIVLTERAPYLITGASPASMTMTKIGTAEMACTSPRSIANLPGAGVVFATANGLAAISSNGAGLLTRAYMEREDWQAYNPATMLGVAHKGRYYAFHDNGCLVYDPAEKESALYNIDLNADAAYRDPLTDRLYLAIGREIRIWDNASQPFTPYIWRSKRYHLPKPAVFSTAKIRAMDYSNLTLRLYAEGALVASINPLDNHAFRLPIAQREMVWEVELTGTGTVYDVQLAEQQAEIE